MKASAGDRKENENLLPPNVIPTSGSASIPAVRTLLLPDLKLCWNTQNSTLAQFLGDCIRIYIYTHTQPDGAPHVRVVGRLTSAEDDANAMMIMLILISSDIMNSAVLCQLPVFRSRGRG